MNSTLITINKVEGTRKKSGKEGQSDMTGERLRQPTLALNMQDGQKQGMRATSRSWKRQERNSPMEPLGRNTAPPLP